jgi:hypothetical protein
LIVSIFLSQFPIGASSGLEMASGTGDGAQKCRAAARELPEAHLSFWKYNWIIVIAIQQSLLSNSLDLRKSLTTNFSRFWRQSKLSGLPFNNRALLLLIKESKEAVELRHIQSIADLICLSSYAMNAAE